MRRIHGKIIMKINRVLISLLVVPVFAFAQAGLPAEGLPNAGLTPESPFYFFDKLGETLREFFTFNPEGKARLQITFAAERVAEIKVILETRGVEAMGLAVAQARLKEHLGDVAKIVIKQKGKGKDVSKLAKELVNTVNLYITNCAVGLYRDKWPVGYLHREQGHCLEER